MRNKTTQAKFVICVAANADADLVVGKAYQWLPDKSAKEAGCLRIIDESGEDYLYPAGWFVTVIVPPVARKRVLKAVKKCAA